MGNISEDPKSEKSISPPVDDQVNVHVYPDWAAMQAYYSQRFVVPQFYGANVPPGHTPHPYMWGPPQHMMPSFGPPYSAIYSHGGVYTNPGVPLAPSVNTETPGKSSGNTDQSLMKKQKGFDGLAMSTGNSNASNGGGGANHTDSQSTETDNSSDVSHSNINKSSDRNAPKRYHRRDRPTIGGDRNIGTRTSLSPDGKENDALGGKIKSVRNPSGVLVKVIAPQPCSAIPNETWLQHEREMKRQRRKQSNRESARRSRLRKQTDLEELAGKVEALAAENASLKSEMIRLTEISEKLMLENASLSSPTEVTGDGIPNIPNKTVVDKLIVEKKSKTATAVAED